jgi:excisionase family DNA binding protein
MTSSDCSTMSASRRRLEDLPDVLSVAETAEALGVAPATVRYWVRKGEIATLDLSGDRRLIPKRQIIDLIEAAGRKRRKCGES